MLDTSFVFALERVLVPPSAPSFEGFRQPGTRGGIEKRVKILTDGYAAYAENWASELDAQTRRIAAAFPVEQANPNELQEFIGFIEEVEDLAEALAVQSERRHKRSKAELKRVSDPDLVRMYQSGDQRLCEIERKIVERLLKLALFLRAIRAEADPAAKGGPTFEDPEDLRRHLASVL